MQLDKTIQSRKSVRKYSSKKPDWRDIIECIDACRYAPMAGNIFSLKFVLVSDKDKIEKLAEAAQQPFVTNAEYVVVVCSNPSRTINAFEERGKMYIKQQTGAAIQNFLLKMTEKGLATCWVGHFVEYLVKDAISIPDNVEVEAMFPVGYESPLPKQKSKMRIVLDRILYFDKYGKKQMKKGEGINA